MLVEHDAETGQSGSVPTIFGVIHGDAKDFFGYPVQLRVGQLVRKKQSLFGEFEVIVCPAAEKKIDSNALRHTLELRLDEAEVRRRSTQI